MGKEYVSYLPYGRGSEILALIAFVKSTIEICMHRYPVGLALCHLEFFPA